jgi:copper chaperone
MQGCGLPLIRKIKQKFINHKNLTIMTKEKVIIENLKCHGCANTIKKGVSKIEGVSDVLINMEDSSVEFALDETIQQRATIIHKLAKLGYPEKGNNNFVSKATSYVSCAVGRMSDKEA